MSLVHLNQENFEEEVFKSEIPVIIDFWAAWCGPCQMMGPVFEEISEDEKFKGKLKFAKLDTEKEGAIASQFQIQGIPALSIVKGNREIDRIVGFAPKDVLMQRIERALKKIEE